MAERKKVSVEEHFAKNARKFLSFGDTFANTLNDKELIAALAQKDLEKLAKVWKLVMELLAENSAGNSSDKLAELIGAYSELGKDGGE